jgi:hypothetical protein
MIKYKYIIVAWRNHYDERDVDFWGEFNLKDATKWANDNCKVYDNLVIADKYGNVVAGRETEGEPEIKPMSCQGDRCRNWDEEYKKCTGCTQCIHENLTGGFPCTHCYAAQCYYQIKDIYRGDT